MNVPGRVEAVAEEVKKIIGEAIELVSRSRGFFVTTAQRCAPMTQVRRSMHQDCLLNPRNFVSYPYFTHFSPFFAHFVRLDARNPENTTRSPGENGTKSIKIG